MRSRFATGLAGIYVIFSALPAFAQAYNPDAYPLQSQADVQAQYSAEQQYPQPIATPEQATTQTTTTRTTTEVFTRPANDISYEQNVQDDQRPQADAAEQTAPTIQNGNIRFISGGVGDTGMQVMEEQQANYNLKMLFVLNAEYVADVGVTIKNMKGETVLSTTTTGPVLLASLPNGRYKVFTRDQGGENITRDIKVSGNRLSSYTLRYTGVDD